MVVVGGGGVGGVAWEVERVRWRDGGGAMELGRWCMYWLRADCSLKKMSSAKMITDVSRRCGDTLERNHVDAKMSPHSMEKSGDTPSGGRHAMAATAIQRSQP